MARSRAGDAASTETSERKRRVIESLRGGDIPEAKREILEGLREDTGEGVYGDLMQEVADVALPESAADVLPVGRVVGRGARVVGKLIDKMPAGKRAAASMKEEVRDLLGVRYKTPEQRERLRKLQDELSSGDTLDYSSGREPRVIRKNK